MFTPAFPAQSEFVAVRGLRYHLRRWGEPAAVTPERPPLLLLHGWMDCGASFQFMVDALRALEGETRLIIAPDWRGFGHSHPPAPVDAYWFADYLGDLDALLAHWPGQAIDLLGHSLGGNVAMAYAGLRPQRIRKLINLEGFGLPAETAAQAPERLQGWLDSLAEPLALKSYTSLDAVAARLRKTNPLLPPERAQWLASQWAQPDAQGRWHILADAAHKRIHPVPYRVDEMLACWDRIEAPLLWVEGDRSPLFDFWGASYRREEFEARLQRVGPLTRARLSPAGHMLQHDQPEVLAAHLQAFLDAPSAA